MLFFPHMEFQQLLDGQVWVFIFLSQAQELQDPYTFELGKRVDSILMAELAALELAVMVAKALQLQVAVFPTDCREAVLKLQRGEGASFWKLRPLVSQNKF
jgi:hypothetical protein